MVLQLFKCSGKYYHCDVRHSLSRGGADRGRGALLGRGRAGKGVRRLRGKDLFFEGRIFVYSALGAVWERIRGVRVVSMVEGKSGKRKGSSTSRGPERSVVGAGENRELLYKQDF